MPELRWILLVLGVLFIGALAWWELRRSRHTRRASDLEHHVVSAEPDLATLRVHREPTISLPEIRGREPVQELPVVEVPDDDSLIGLRIDGQRVEEDAPPARAPEPETILPAPPLPAEEEVSAPAPLDIEPPRELIIDWPPAEQRELLALRLVAPPERFSGRVIRQALTGEGFLHGRFEIFHKPAADGRVIMSAASLTKPGTFDLETMDMQRFGGLNLFAVLPGPLPPASTFDEMISVARALNARLHGALQDERGMPLTATSIARIRDNLLASGETSDEPVA